MLSLLCFMHLESKAFDREICPAWFCRQTACVHPIVFDYLFWLCQICWYRISGFLCLFFLSHWFGKQCQFPNGCIDCCKQLQQHPMPPLKGLSLMYNLPVELKLPLFMEEMHSSSPQKPFILLLFHLILTVAISCGIFIDGPVWLLPPELFLTALF